MPRINAGEGAPTSSRFGGRPALQPGEVFPICGACHTSMPLLVQLNLAEIPEAARAAIPAPLRTGLLQLFYCTNGDCNNDDFGAFTHNALARVLAASTLPALVFKDGPALSAARVTGWWPLQDLPDGDEADIQGVKLTDKQCHEYYETRYAEGKDVPIQGDKLLGWPDWIQGVFYPSCPVCSGPMTYVLQVASEDHIPFMFGDAGVGHVCVCPSHPGRASFYWSCC
ncbi:MAG: DUF1963 domain-containing protein [Phycisphaerales bacterium]